MNSAPSNGRLIGGTLTSGIQDIAALLPLLGTEQCEDHIGSALTNGFLYAAVTPMSLFGSLGVAKAGFKTFLASINIPQLKLEGTRILADAGFKSQGENLPLITIDKDQKNNLCAEERIKSMLKEFYIEDSKRITVSSKNWRWNLAMVLSTAICCMIGMTPYIHLNLGQSRLNHFVRWVFPAMRVIGGFLTATMIQLLIQSRLLEITRKRLILDGLDKAKFLGLNIDVGETSDWARYSTLEQRFYLLRQKLIPPKRSDHTHAAPSSPHQIDDKDSGSVGSARPRATRAPSSLNHRSCGVEYVPRISSAQIPDPEKGVVEPKSTQVESITDGDLELRIREACGSSVLRWIYLVLLFIGILASIAGYIGCFSVVQSVESSGKALIWVCLEGGLSVLRMIIWSLNPKSDDASALEFKLKLNEHSPLPTCTRSAEHIEEEKDLPLVRAPEFLDTITSYTGLLKRFSDPTQPLTLYYTLTRRHDMSPETGPEHRCGKHVLYITIFHHSERTTRVYAEDIKSDEKAMSSETSDFYSADAVTVDLEHGVLRTKVGRRIQHKDDPIAGNDTLRMALKDHYKSILNQMNHITTSPRDDVLENDWTLKFGQTQSKMQRAADPKCREAITDAGEKSEEDDYMCDHGYLEQGWLERKVRRLVVARGEWITAYMEWLYGAIDRMLEAQGVEIEGGERMVVEILLVTERAEMEYMLVDEVYEWEKKLRVCFQDFVDKYGLDAGLRERLEKVWRANSWERLEEGRLAMTARVDADSGLQRVAGTGKEGANERFLKRAQSDCGDNTRRKWERLFELSSNPASLPTVQRQTPRERLESRLKDLRIDAEKEKSRFQEGLQKMATRLRREVKGVEDRLNRGFEARHEFWSHHRLVELMHSESKWLEYNPSEDRDDIMRGALINNEYVKHIELVALGDIQDDNVSFFTMIRDKVACTSVCIYGDRRNMSASIELSPNIISISGQWQLSEDHEAVLNRNIFRLDEDKRTTFEFKGLYIGVHDLRGRGDCSFTVRFWGPSSGRLKLQLIHHSAGSKSHLAVEIQAQGEKSCEHIPLSNIFTLNEIMIWDEPRPSSESGELTFTRNVRNTLTCTFKLGDQGERQQYYLRDIKLLDDSNEPYEPASGHRGEDPSSHLGDSSAFIEEASESDQGDGDANKGQTDARSGREENNTDN